MHVRFESHRDAGEEFRLLGFETVQTDKGYWFFLFCFVILYNDTLRVGGVG